MFKWPNPPSSRAKENELADWIELNCLRQSSVSKTELSQLLGRLEENDNSDGVPEQDQIDTYIEGAYKEIERRKIVCKDGYPFNWLEHKSLTLCRDLSNPKHTIYLYLLLTTRLNMKNRRSFSDIDATHLFEELAEQVAQRYFGERAESMLFGHRKGGPIFEERVNMLCARLNEGGGFRNPDIAQPTAKDDKLDVVVWKSFTDGLPSKLIGFGQCKTGTSYLDSISELQPDVFCGNWMREQPILKPIRMFFITESLSSSSRNKRAREAGLLFDRSRIIDYSDEITDNVLHPIETWTRVAVAEEILSITN